MKRFGILAGLMLASGVPVAASAQQMAQPVCAPGVDPALPPELVGWKAPIPLVAASDKSGLKLAILGPGIAASATLSPTAQIRYLAPPGKPGTAASYGGLFAFSITRAGTYRFALGAGAWIDVIAAKKMLEPAGHGHGPDCSSVRKMVDFALTPSVYVLQIAGNTDPLLRLMIARLR